MELWGSSEKIHDLARIFMLTEEQSSPIMKGYNVSYVLVFTPDDLQKFAWIAKISVTTQRLLRPLFDDALHPNRFTKLYDNGRGKIYRVEYP